MTRDAAFIAGAVALSAQALTRPGTGPFGAVAVRDGVVAGRGLNHARATLDRASHGEAEAIRDPCRTPGTPDLSGRELFSSCEPCAPCVAAAEVEAAGMVAPCRRARDPVARDLLGQFPRVRRRPRTGPRRSGPVAGAHA